MCEYLQNKDNENNQIKNIQDNSIKNCESQIQKDENQIQLNQQINEDILLHNKNKKSISGKKLYQKIKTNFTYINDLDNAELMQVTFYLLRKKQRNQFQVQVIYHCTKEIKFFKEILLSKNGSDIHYKCCKHLKLQFFKGGETIFNKGENGNLFYIILIGQISITQKEWVLDQESGEKMPTIKELVRLNSGNCFGELGLQNDARRVASAGAVVDSYLAVLEKQDFKDAISELNQDAAYIQYFGKMGFFKDWDYNKIKVIYDVSEEVQFSKDNFVFREGDNFNGVYFVKQGEFRVEKTVDLSQFQENFEHKKQKLSQNSSDLKSFLTMIKNQDYEKNLYKQKNRQYKTFVIEKCNNGCVLGIEDLFSVKRSFSLVSSSEQSSLYFVPDKMIYTKIFSYYLKNQIKNSVDIKMNYLMSNLEKLIEQHYLNMELLCDLKTNQNREYRRDSQNKELFEREQVQVINKEKVQQEKFLKFKSQFEKKSKMKQVQVEQECLQNFANKYKLNQIFEKSSQKHQFYSAQKVLSSHKNDSVQNIQSEKYLVQSKNLSCNNSGINKNVVKKLDFILKQRNRSYHQIQNQNLSLNYKIQKTPVNNSQFLNDSQLNNNTSIIINQSQKIQNKSFQSESQVFENHQQLILKEKSKKQLNLSEVENINKSNNIQNINNEQSKLHKKSISDLSFMRQRSVFSQQNQNKLEKTKLKQFQELMVNKIFFTSNLLEENNQRKQNGFQNNLDSFYRDRQVQSQKIINGSPVNKLNSYKSTSFYCSSSKSPVINLFENRNLSQDEIIQEKQIELKNDKRQQKQYKENNNMSIKTDEKIEYNNLIINHCQRYNKIKQKFDKIGNFGLFKFEKDFLQKQKNLQNQKKQDSIDNKNKIVLIQNNHINYASQNQDDMSKYKKEIRQGRKIKGSSSVKNIFYNHNHISVKKSIQNVDDLSVKGKNPENSQKIEESQENQNKKNRNRIYKNIYNGKQKDLGLNFSNYYNQWKSQQKNNNLLLNISQKKNQNLLEN